VSYVFLLATRYLLCYVLRYFFSPLCFSLFRDVYCCYFVRGSFFIYLAIYFVRYVFLSMLFLYVWVLFL